MPQIVRVPAGAADIRYAESIRQRSLRHFHAALMAVDTSPVDIVVIGTSITEGAFATSRATRWHSIMRDRLRTRWQPAGVTGGEGYIPAYYQLETPAPYIADGVTEWLDAFTVVGSPTVTNNYGLGRRSYQFAGAGSLEIAVTCTGVDVYWAGGPSTGTFSWAVDGGATTNVNTVLGTATDGHVTQIRGLSAGSHTITLTRVSGTIILDGIMVYNGDETSGIRIWESGFSGAESDFFSTATPWQDTLTTINPDLVMVEGVINDFLSNARDANATYTPTYLRTNLEATVTWIRAKTSPDASIVFVPAPKPSTTPLDYSYEEYVRQMYAVARSDGNVGVFDIAERFGDLAVVDGLLYDDIIHPLDVGHKLWGVAAASYLEP